MKYDYACTALLFVMSPTASNLLECIQIKKNDTPAGTMGPLVLTGLSRSMAYTRSIPTLAISIVRPEACRIIREDARTPTKKDRMNIEITLG